MIGMEPTSQKLHDHNLIFLIHNGIVLKTTQGLRQEMIVGRVHQGKLSWMFRIPQLKMQEMIDRSVHQWSLSWISSIPKLMMQLKMDIWVCEYVVL